MAAQKIKKFINDLNQFHQNKYEPYDALVKLVNSADTGVPALDHIFQNATVIIWGWWWSGWSWINRIDVTTIVELIIGADIVELNARMKSNVNVTANDITLLRKAVGFTPQRALFDLKKEIKTNYQKYKHLNVTVETYDHLSESAREEILRIENFLIKKMPNTTQHLTIGSITVQPGWILINLFDAIRTRIQSESKPESELKIPIHQFTQNKNDSNSKDADYLLILIGIKIVILLIFSIVFSRKNGNKLSLSGSAWISPNKTLSSEL